MKKLIEKYNQYAHHLIAVVALMTRMTIACIFIPAGWGKLNNLGGTTEFFQSLGIPLAFIQAPLVGGLEFFGGILLALGLMTRVISLPLMVTMVVATLTAKWPEVESALELLDASEFLYVVLLAWLLAVGPGVFSMDRLISKKLSI